MSRTCPSSCLDLSGSLEAPGGQALRSPSCLHTLQVTVRPFLTALGASCVAWSLVLGVVCRLSQASPDADPAHTS